MSDQSKDAILSYRHNLQVRLTRQWEIREALRQQALQAISEKGPALLSVYPSVRRAYVFGSVLHPGAFHAESDLDIAVEDVTMPEYFALWGTLEQALPEWTIDLRDLTPASAFAEIIRQTGVLIYERTDSSVTS